MKSSELFVGLNRCEVEEMCCCVAVVGLKMECAKSPIPPVCAVKLLVLAKEAVNLFFVLSKQEKQQQSPEDDAQVECGEEQTQFFRAKSPIQAIKMLVETADN